MNPISHAIKEKIPTNLNSEYRARRGRISMLFTTCKLHRTTQYFCSYRNRFDWRYNVAIKVLCVYYDFLLQSTNQVDNEFGHKIYVECITLYAADKWTTNSFQSESKLYFWECDKLCPILPSQVSSNKTMEFWSFKLLLCKFYMETILTPLVRILNDCQKFMATIEKASSNDRIILCSTLINFA